MANSVRLTVDADQTDLIATGKVNPVRSWDQDAGGFSKAQDTDDDTGLPLWDVECMLSDPDAFRSDVVGVRVAMQTVPSFQPFTRVQFEGLRVNVRANKQGQLAQYWNASGVVGAEKATTKAA